MVEVGNRDHCGLLFKMLCFFGLTHSAEEEEEDKVRGKRGGGEVYLWRYCNGGQSEGRKKLIFLGTFKCFRMKKRK